MSVVFEDTATALPQLQHSGSRVLQNDKNTVRSTASNKPKGIRTDSPTTIQACEELGLLLDDLKQKNAEDFRDPQVEEAIVQIRYNHYLKRFNQTIKDVTSQKKQITRRMRKQLLQTTSDNLRTQTANPTAQSRNNLAMNSSCVFTKPFTPYSPMGKSVVISPIHTNFNRTISYFRTSHKSPNVKNIDEVVGADEPQSASLTSPVGNFHKTFSEEISKFNKAKRQQQREAREAYEEEIKRIKVMEDFKEKEKRRLEKEKKEALERKKKEEERRRLEEDKAERIKELEKDYKIKKQMEKEKMKQKLDGARKKFQHENEEKRRLISERDRLLDLKLKEVDEKRRKLQDEEIRNSDQLKFDIERELSSKQEKRRMNVNEKSMKVRVKLDKLEEEFERIKEKQARDAEEYVQKVVEKLVKKEESIKVFRDKHYKTLKKKEEDYVERNKRHNDNQHFIQDQYKARMKEINDRFRKVQENLETKRKQDDNDRKLKGEVNRLKGLDKLENHSRLQRRLQFERLKILDKERAEHEKIVLIRGHKEIAQKTKLEASVQAKVEKDKIRDSVNQLRKLVYMGNSSTVVTESQRKILKSVLQPDDYETIEEAEKQRELERKILLGQIDEINNPQLLASLSSVLLKKKN